MVTEQKKFLKGQVLITKQVLECCEKKIFYHSVTPKKQSKPLENKDLCEGVKNRHMGDSPNITPFYPPANGVYTPDFRNDMARSRFFEKLFALKESPFVEIDDSIWSLFLKKWNRSKELCGNKSVAVRLPVSGISIVDFVLRYVGKQKLVLGFDTEWVENLTDDGYIRTALSYQFSTTLDDTQYDFVFIPDKKETGYGFGEMLYWIVNTYFAGYGFMVAGHREKHKTRYFESSRIMLVGHFVGVDISLLQDARKLIEYKTFSAAQRKSIAKIYDKMQPLLDIPADQRDLTQAKDLDILQRRVKKIEDKPDHASNLVCLNKHCLYTTRIPRIYNYWIEDYQLYIEFRLEIRDTMLISDGKSGLATLGASLGIPKLDTEELDKADNMPIGYYKSHMDVLLKNHPDFYLEYAARDARISFEWYNKFRGLVGDATTTSAAGANFVTKYLKSLGYDMDKDIRGFSMIDDKPNYSAYYESRGDLGDIPDLAYYGGRNECFTHGLVDKATVDLDLLSAYLVAMQSIPAIDWSKPLIRLPAGHKMQLSDWTHPTQVGFGYVKFRFPEDTKYPCIPLKSAKSDLSGTPIFLLEGEGLVSAPDIYAALIMGAEVTVDSQGFKFIYCDKDFKEHPMGTAVRVLVKKRREMATIHGKKSVEALLYKLLGVSIYGKTGQGIHGKKSRQVLTDEMINIPFCGITNGVLASTITAIVRQLLGLIMYYVDSQSYEVHSVTTDGFITDYPEAQIPDIDAYLYGITPIYQSVIDNCFGGGSILEPKHRQPSGFFNIKTRGNIGFDEGSVFAKAGYRGSESFRALSELEQHTALLDMVIKRQGRINDSKASMLSFREMKSGSLKTLTKMLENPNKLLSLDFDFKRFLTSRDFTNVNIKIGTYRFRSDYGLIKTRPFETMNEYEHYADIYRSFIASGYNIKTDDDLEALHYAVKYGFPKIKVNKEEQTSTELIKFRKDYTSHKITQFLIMYFEHPHLLNDNYFDAWNRNMFLELFQGLYKVDCLNLWKNTKKNKTPYFDLILARHVEREIKQYMDYTYPTT